VTPLLEGRLKHLHGQIDNDRRSGEKGAKGYYLECLVPTREIEELGGGDSTSEAASQVVADDNQAVAEAPGVWPPRQQLIYRIKHTATYWLAVLALDAANYRAAANYSGKRTLDAVPRGRWSSGARYHLARACEAIGRRDRDAGQLEQARRHYLADPLSYGNRLRARRLTDLLQTSGQERSDP
jgi:hypothetical protein